MQDQRARRWLGLERHPNRVATKTPGLILVGRFADMAGEFSTTPVVTLRSPIW